MEQAELDSLMQVSAVDAAKTAQQEFEIELDFTVDSIARVDDILLGFVDKYHDKALEDSAVFTICNIFGAYLGECYKKVGGGSWLYDATDPKAPFVLLEVGTFSYAFAGICYERLVNDSAISVKAYFDQALANHSQ